jgi:hypothetical protein
MIRCRPLKGAKMVKVILTIPEDGIGDKAVANLFGGDGSVIDLRPST